jgi:hydrogenase expression/formation protein HypD
MNTLMVESSHAVRRLLSAAAKTTRTLAFMEVCGTHTTSAFRCGLHSLMPPNISLISGPGCPVCVTSQADVDQMIELAQQPKITLCTYGDMLRVSGSSGSLESARAKGCDVRVVYSALDAVRLAEKKSSRQVVFAGVGFETTTPATAVAVLQAARLGLRNFTALPSHKLIIPAMDALMTSGNVKIDGFLCPGHVAVIIGALPFGHIVRTYRRGCVIVGFEDFQIAQGLAALTDMTRTRSPRLENQYPQAVTPWGNRLARNLIRQVFEPADVRWRGLGVLPRSGLVLRAEFSEFDARVRFKLKERDVKDPRGCRCGDVITGRCRPIDCKLFGKSCTPVQAVGPCMVSSEGACQAWFKYGRDGGKRRAKEALA